VTGTEPQGQSQPLSFDDGGAGVPVVLVHAFPLDRRMWAATRAELGDGVRLLTPDVAGFGGSTVPDGDPSLDAVADQLAALLDRLGLEQAVVGGLSMGGYIALAFARRHPDRLLGVLLADTKATADTDAAAQNRRRIASVALAEGSARVVVEEVVPNLVGPTTAAARPEVLEAVRVLAAQAHPAAIAWAQRAMADRGDSFDVLRRLDVPVLVLVGDEDAVTPLGEAAAMSGTARRALLHTFDGSGHLSAMEQPAAFAAALRDWLIEWDLVRRDLVRGD
jgi:pimeloyl-ACP methyl ester carboxylesterase